MLMFFKTEFISFTQRSSVQTVSGESVKYLESFTYLGSEVKFSEQDVKFHKAEAWVIE